MNSKVKINQDIFNALEQIDFDTFSVIKIRDIIQTSSNQYKNNNVARLFVARKLEYLETIGALKSSGSGRSKRYLKTQNFYTINFEKVKKREHQQCSPNILKEESSLTAQQLEKERKDIETELTVILVELDEYKRLMNRSKTLQTILQPTYKNTTQKSATLMAQLNVWTNAISLLKKHERVSC
ncbi:hypothetical protein [uncultured Photobacterium sp.]|uniref:hypothetical protein n=1 Tax=uncultured Photobacterium sp. TaxID=173973 RepID=UPI00260AEFD0|nr:hypothetical protein [uncultured Photobacterium sp.]